jgi:hypothetical protein
MRRAAWASIMGVQGFMRSLLSPSIMCRARRAEVPVAELPGSPSAPKRAHQRIGTERHPVESRDPLRSPYTPKQARTQSAIVTSDFAAGDDAEQPAARRDQIMSDHDLDRLEAGLRQLQRQESATRLRATNLAPVPGRALVHASGRRESGNRCGDGFRSPRSLEPERLPPPPEMPSHSIGITVGIMIAIILVATVAYYFAVGGGLRPSEPTPAPQTASSDPTLVALPSSPISQQAPPPTMAQEDDHPRSAPSEISSHGMKTSQRAKSSEGEAVAMVQLDERGAQVPAASKATHLLDPEEINLFVKQGEQFIAAGDVVTARIVFQRAANAGDAGAAVALGGTYDPIVLAKSGVAGLSADVEKARTWYRKAESLGSAEAARRLVLLANR